VDGVDAPLMQATNKVIPTTRIAVKDPRGLCVHINYAVSPTIDARCPQKRRGALGLLEQFRCRSGLAGARSGDSTARRPSYNGTARPLNPGPLKGQVGVAAEDRAAGGGQGAVGRQQSDGYQVSMWVLTFYSTRRFMVCESRLSADGISQVDKIARPLLYITGWKNLIPIRCISTIKGEY